MANFPKWLDESDVFFTSENLYPFSEVLRSVKLPTDQLEQFNEATINTYLCELRDKLRRKNPSTKGQENNPFLNMLETADNPPKDYIATFSEEELERALFLLQTGVTLRGAFDYHTATFRLKRDPTQVTNQIEPEMQRNGLEGKNIYFHGGRYRAETLNSELQLGKLTFTRQEIGMNFPAAIEKVNDNKERSIIEDTVLRALKGDEEANSVTPLGIDGNSVFMTRSSGLDLYTKACFRNVLKISDDELKTNYENMIAEAAHISVKFTETNALDDKIKCMALSEKYKDLQKEFNISRSEAERIYYTLKIKQSLGLSQDDRVFDELFAPIQKFVNEYAIKNSVWLTDRKPKNRSNENYDYSFLNFAPVTTELVTMLETVPGYLGYGNEDNNAKKDHLMKVYLDLRNRKSSFKISLDPSLKEAEQFVISYYTERLVKSVRETFFSLYEAESAKRRELSVAYFEYAPKICDAQNFYQLIDDSLNALQKDFKVISEESRKKMWNIISNKYLARRDAIATEEEFTEDLKIYQRHMREFIPGYSAYSREKSHPNEKSEAELVLKEA